MNLNALKWNFQFRIKSKGTISGLVSNLVSAAPLAPGLKALGNLKETAIPLYVTEQVA